MRIFDAYEQGDEYDPEENVEYDREDHVPDIFDTFMDTENMDSLLIDEDYQDYWD